MSLDIYLTRKRQSVYNGESFVRHEEEDCFDCNITHNLAKMADEAGIYEALWKPETVGIETAEQLHDRILTGVNDMKNRPEHFKNFDSDNGWGMYKDFMPWLERLLEACKEYPNATISVSR